VREYAKEMRKLIGHEILLTVGCGAIIEDENGRILLQSRKDTDLWGIPGGLMEFGETFLETLERELFEETNLSIIEPKLFGVYSGPSGFGEYPNGDKVYSVQIIFKTNKYTGTLKQEGDESKEHKFFDKSNLPTVNSCQMPFIIDWINNKSDEVFVR
jgi:ADP-ribose pyrophosphatase YjhB (NUDIX family)